MEHQINQRVAGAVVTITNRCNFQCPQCCEVQNNQEMSPEDLDFVLNSLENAFFHYLCIFGGEARLHRQFTAVMEIVKNHNPIKDGKRPINVEVYTNGYGMKDETASANIINRLAALGVTKLAISTDKGHREYAKQKSIPIDYDTIDKLTNLLDHDIKKKLDIPDTISIFRAGNGQYALPLGKAKTLSWEERLGLGRYAAWNTPEAYETVHHELMEEFDHWSTVESFSHTCYCHPTKTVKAYEKIKNKRSPDKTAYWNMYIDSSLNVGVCPFNIVPSLGSLRELSVVDLFHKLTHSSLYSLLAHEGPQGIARQVWNISEPDLRAQFLERTPCGLCEDLMITNQADLYQMFSMKTV